MHECHAADEREQKAVLALVLLGVWGHWADGGMGISRRDGSM